MVEGAALEMLLGGYLYESSNLSVSVAVVCESGEDPVGHFADGRNLGSRPHGTPSIGAAVAQHLDMVEVTGSNPVSTIAPWGNNPVRTRGQHPTSP